MTVASGEPQPSPLRPARRLRAAFVLIGLVGVMAGLLAYVLQASKNHDDADERFAVLSHRVTQGIIERLRRYEYGLRGARGARRELAAGLRLALGEAAAHELNALVQALDFNAAEQALQANHATTG